MAADSSRCNVLLVYPKFSVPSFWQMQRTCEVAGVRHTASPLGLITVAALLPKSWSMRLIDCNIEDLRDSDLRWADMVMTGGMIPQQQGTFEVIDRAHAAGKPVVVGGPDVSSSPHLYQRAEFRVLGEAENVIHAFIEAWEAGRREGLFEFAGEKFQVDVTRSPVPRFDLLQLKQYIFIGVQFSRGCPFNCEFCDIIELYGRVPRAKTNEQMLAELDVLYGLGLRGHVDFVDDNLIGNKKALKRFLPELIAWQKARNFPFEFSTEASINLADDDQLLGMLRDANFFVIFVGLETPDPQVLVSTQKKQNTRRELAECVHKIYSYGIVVNAGFILGFDGEKVSAADALADFVEASAIPVSMVSLLCAMPNTQLTRRLQREGRLHQSFEVWSEGDNCINGLNFETVRARRDIFADFITAFERIHSPAAYFERVRVVGRELRRPESTLPCIYRLLPRDLLRLGRLWWWIVTREPRLIGLSWRTLWDCYRHNPIALRWVAQLIAMYLHIGPYSREVIALFKRGIADIDNGKWESPPIVAALDADADAAAKPVRLAAVPFEAVREKVS
jgi:radical SAM superfamily enzyme YgiQ (UPF0313 family)